MHTIIIGNGILGLTIAFRLLKQSNISDKITIVGPASRIGSATLAAGAMLNSFAEVEAGSLDSEIDRYRFELSRMASCMWPEFESEITNSANTCRLPLNLYRCSLSNTESPSTGTYIINNTAADSLDDENFEAIINALTNYGEAFESVSTRDIPNYSPSQKHRATRAIYIPREGWVNPQIILEKLDIALKADSRVSFKNLPATKLEYSAGCIRGVQLSDNQILEGEKYVLCNGASISDFLFASKLDLNIQRVFYGIGVSLEVKCPDLFTQKCIRTPNRGLACGLYNIPYSSSAGSINDHTLLGASNFISPVPQISARAGSVESILRGAMEQINVGYFRSELIRVNVGWRPTTVDTYPIVGATSIKNLLVAGGTKRDGFHLSPVISDIMVCLLSGQEVDTRFSAFAPERMPIRSLTRHAAIDKAVRHQISAAYQHGFNPAMSRMPEQIAKAYREDLERLHDKVGAHDWGIPPEMTEMYRYGHITPS